MCLKVHINRLCVHTHMCERCIERHNFAQPLDLLPSSGQDQCIKPWEISCHLRLLHAPLGF